MLPAVAIFLKKMLDIIETTFSKLTCTPLQVSHQAIYPRSKFSLLLSSRFKKLGRRRSIAQPNLRIQPSAALRNPLQNRSQETSRGKSKAEDRSSHQAIVRAIYDPEMTIRSKQFGSVIASRGNFARPACMSARARAIHALV